MLPILIDSLSTTLPISYIYVYTYTHLWIYIYVFYQFICVLWRTWFYSYTHVYDYIVAHIYIYVCIYVYVYLYIYTYIHTHIRIFIFYEYIVHVQYHHVQRRSPRHFLYKVLHVHRQFSPLSSEWSRVQWRSPRHQRCVVGCISADRVLLTISSMHRRAAGPLRWPVSPDAHHCWIQFCAGLQVLVYIAGVWTRCPIPATEYAAAGCSAMKMDSNAKGTHP